MGRPKSVPPRTNSKPPMPPSGCACLTQGHRPGNQRLANPHNRYFLLHGTKLA
ncbi:hypothetical protein ACS15_0028 [Ralstonia insidiosa]|uniref:Uncharacterized protein n=1 Tax=Ralstonia insidiosa TaxID=190721 RepID=A0AAC9BJN8_9RALS|nr:hypothetical protein ACS15_0028 [Ralstonia insidiosa]